MSSQFLDDLLEFMRRCQDELVGPEQYARVCGAAGAGGDSAAARGEVEKAGGIGDAEILDRCQEIARVFATVEEMLREKNLGTFGHMITWRVPSAEERCGSAGKRSASRHTLSAGR